MPDSKVSAMIKIKISKAHEAKIRQGYPWIFYYQMQNEDIEGKSGDLAVVYDSRNRFLAIGLFDPESDIRLRVLQIQNPVKIDSDFFAERLRQALQLREALEGEGTTGYRVINGENDGFPGLVLDRYESTAVLKLYTAAWIPFLEILLQLFKNQLSLERCVLRWSRNALESRAISDKWHEGCVLFGDPVEAPVHFKENEISFEADVLSGQKTGFFLDQRDNRQRIRALSEGKSVLNVFSYTGGFSVYAFSGGARSVLEVDTNSFALAVSKKNLLLNFPKRKFSVEQFRQVKADGFDTLSNLESTHQKFDLVILDPPAFARRNKQTKTALSAYTKLAEAGARVTAKDGIVFAASCSVHVKAQDFYQAVLSGIKFAGREYEEISRTGHAKDHPVSFSQGEYLKGVFCRIIR
jgi:23S rRNA (cytosine1962-C5)-methyltransferase